MFTDFKTLLKTNFSYLWMSQILSQIAINIMNFLLLIELFARTSSSIATSFLWVAYALPAVLIGPIAAASIDLVDKRKVLMVSNLLQSFVILLYALYSGQDLFLPYGIALFYSLLNQFYLPAESSSVPMIVDKSELPRANGLFFLTQQGALIIGFGLAGALNHWLGFNTSLFLCSIFLFIAFVSVFLLPSLKGEDKLPETFENAFFTFFKKIIDGYNFIKSNNSVLTPFLLLMTLQILLTVVTVNAPLIAQDILKINLNLAGIFIVAPAAVGSAIGAITIPQFLKKGVRKKKLIQRSVMTFLVAIFVFTLIVPEQITVIRIALGILAISVVGYSFVGILIPAQTFLQEKTPGGYRGRVFGNFWFMTTIATIIPVIFSGTISEIFGIRLLLMLIGLIMLSFLVFSRKILRSFPLS